MAKFVVCVETPKEHNIRMASTMNDTDTDFRTAQLSRTLLTHTQALYGKQGFLSILILASKLQDTNIDERAGVGFKFSRFEALCPVCGAAKDGLIHWIGRKCASMASSDLPTRIINQDASSVPVDWHLRFAGVCDLRRIRRGVYSSIHAITKQK